jgi:16S rRNA (guanine966-N2)-methyltransferase
MKDRVREALFNLLGPTVKGKHAVDLFAGTGALGLEAISRGAARATLLEQHFPTARLLAENISALGLEGRAEPVVGNVFVRSLWQDRLGEVPWLVFSSPPYAFYVDRRDEMLDLLGWLVQTAPPDSVFAVESDERFDFRLPPDPTLWRIRTYRPAVIGIYEKRG